MIVIKPKINFKDKRGSIKDIFYKKKINHVAIIKSRAGVRRGDHYHKKTTQWMLHMERNLMWGKTDFVTGCYLQFNSEKLTKSIITQ